MRFGLIALVWLAACGGDGGTTPTTATDAVDETSTPDVSLPDATGLPETGIGDQPLAGICQNDGQCVTGFCNTFPAGGYCTLECDDDAACGEDAKCLQDFVALGRKDKVCLKQCTSQVDCRDDQFCPSDAKLCIARCQPGSCLEGYTCNAEGRCVTAPPCVPVAEIEDDKDQDCDSFVDEGFGPAIARPEHVVVHDFGQVQLGGTGVSRSFSFFADEGTASFSVVVINLDHPESFLQLYSLVGPDGTDLMGGGDPYLAPNRAFPSFSAYTVQVPNSDVLQIEPGRYGFSIYSFPDDAGNAAPASKGWVYVVENRRVGATASTLDVNYWFVGIPDMDASKAQTEPRFKQLLARFEALMGNAGITVGSRRYLNVTGADAQRFTIVDTGDTLTGVDEHAELLATTSSLDAENTGVSFFFVQGFTGWDLLGKAGGIPGPPMLHGTYNSGVVVSLADYLNWVEEPAIALELTAQTMAHELCHQLGLYHVTEGDGERFDNVQDTPECPRSSNDQNGDGVMDPQECSGKGSSNLMFWAASLGTSLSQGQRKVLHKNPTLRD